MQGGILPLNHFYLSWARDSTRLASELGSVELQVVVWLYSGLVSFLGSGHEVSTQLDSGSVCSKPGSARGSAGLAIRGSAYLGSWIGFGLGIGSALGESAQCLAQLSSEIGSELSSGSAGARRLMIRLGLAQGSALLT